MSAHEAKGKQRLRIAVLNRHFSPTGGGAERYSIALVEQLAQRHEIHVFAQHIEHQWPGVTYHRVRAGLRRPRWINQLWFATATWWATRHGFDLVHSHENTWHGQVQTVHVLPVKYNLFQGRTGWRRALQWVKVWTSPRLLAYLGLERARFAPQPGRRIVVTSASLMRQMALTYPMSANRLSLVTPGVAAIPGRPTAAQQLAARQHLGLPAQGRAIGFVGNDYRKKGLQTLLQALVQLPADVWLLVVGNGAHIAEFRALAQSLGVASRVFFLGALKEVADAYLAADCLAHPTLEDTFAMVVLEAMAHGLPVVVSCEHFCGISGLLTHEINALLLESPHNVTTLAQALLRVLDEPGLPRALSDAATEFARRYSWSSVALQQDAIYQAAMRGREPEPSEIGEPAAPGNDRH